MDHLVDQPLNVVNGFRLLHANLVLGPNLASEAAQVLVAPANKVLSCAEETVFQRIRLIVFARDHAYDRAELSQLILPFFG